MAFDILQAIKEDILKTYIDKKQYRKAFILVKEIIDFQFSHYISREELENDIYIKLFNLYNRTNVGNNQIIKKYVAHYLSCKLGKNIAKDYKDDIFNIDKLYNYNLEKCDQIFINKLLEKYDK